MLLYFTESRQNDDPHVSGSKSLGEHGYKKHTVIEL